MNRHTGKRRLVATVALLAPVLVVQGFRAISGWHVETSSAAAPRPVEPPAPKITPVAPLSSQAKKAQEWLTARGPLSVKRSPMEHLPASMKPPTPPISAPPDPSLMPEPRVPVRMPNSKLTLTGIVGGGSSNMASISGHVYRLGEDVEAGWTIISIHPRRMVVVLSGPEGQVVELSRSGIEPR